MTLLHLFLIHRYKTVAVHYLSPTPDNHAQADGMKQMDIYSEVNDEVGEIIVADVNEGGVARLLNPDRVALTDLIEKGK